MYNIRPKVTNASTGKSFQNYGLAFDFAIYYDHNSDGDFKAISWDMKEDFDHDGQADWYEVINYFKSKLIGFAWGVDFKSIKDHPHFEKIFGNS